MAGLSRAEQRSRAATMRNVGSITGATGVRPSTARGAGRPTGGPPLQATPPSDAPLAAAVGGGVTGLGSAIVSHFNPIAGALVALFGGLGTLAAGQAIAGEEDVEARRIAMSNRRAMGEATLEDTRTARRHQREEYAQQPSPRQEMMQPQGQAPPGAADLAVRRLLGRG